MTIINVSQTGATGDGVTIDSVSIKAAIDTNASVVEFDSGKTYLIDRPIYPKSNQTIRLNGGTIKRRNQVVTALMADAPAGSTSIEVQDASQLFEDMWITPLNQDSASPLYGNAGEEGVNHIIDSVVGNVIHFHNGLSKGYVAGNPVINLNPMFWIYSNRTNTIVRDGTIDGNRANNNRYFSWQVGQSFMFSGNSNLITMNSLINSVGDVAYMPYAADCTLLGNNAVNVGGSFAHLSSSVNTLIKDNEITQVNMSSEPEHTEGVVTFSYGVHNTSIHINLVKDGSGLIFAGVLNMADSHSVDIKGNSTMNCSKLFRARRLPGQQILAQNFVFQDNAGDTRVEIEID